MTAARALAPSPTAPQAYVPLDAIIVDTDWNARRVTDPHVLDGIRQSMIDLLTSGQHPQLAPVEVTTRADRYELIAGFSRIGILRALATPNDDGTWPLPDALLARPEARAWLEAPTAWVLITGADTSADARLVNLAENTRRQPLHPADLAVSLAELLPERRPGGRAKVGELTSAVAAKRLGIDDRTVANLARVGRALNAEQIAALRQGGIGVKEAIALAGMEAAARAEAWAVFVATGKLPRPKPAPKPPKPEATDRDDAGDDDASPAARTRASVDLASLDEDHRRLVLERFGSAASETLSAVVDVVRGVVATSDGAAGVRARELSDELRPWDATSATARVYHLTLAAIIADQPTTRLAARRELETILEQAPGGTQAALFPGETETKPKRGKKPEPKAKAKKPEAKGKARAKMPKGNVRGSR